MQPAKILLLVIAVASAVAALAAGAWLALRTQPPAADPVSEPVISTATVYPSPVSLPAVTLINQSGAEVNEGFFTGQWDVVFFGFATCPDICPITLRVLRDAQLELQANGADIVPRIVLVSVDPERDTPEVLSEYMQSFGENSAAVTGEPGQLQTLASELGIFYQKRYVDEDFYTMDHSSVVLVVDPGGDVRALFSSPHRAANFVTDLPILTRL